MYRIFSWAAALGLLASCSGNPSEQNSSANISPQNQEIKINRHFLVFVDKTLSNNDSMAIQQHSSALRRWLADSLQGNGDRIAAWPINANTGGDAPFLNETINVPPPQLEGVGMQTAEDNQAKFDAEIKRTKNRCIEQVEAALSAQNTSSTNQYTDLWRSLEAASRYFGASAQPTDRCYLVWVSDMVESMKGDGRRDFHTKAIQTKEEAETLAAADAEYLRQHLKINASVLKKVQFVILFPNQPNSVTHNNMMRYYWEKLLSEVGVSEKNIRYQL
jgi:hypothetical protein